MSTASERQSGKRNNLQLTQHKTSTK